MPNNYSSPIAKEIGQQIVASYNNKDGVNNYVASIVKKVDAHIRSKTALNEVLSEVYNA